MSNYYQMTKHPETGKYENAFWIDDKFGNHRYGVKFPDGKIYEADSRVWEFEEKTKSELRRLEHQLK